MAITAPTPPLRLLAGKRGLMFVSILFLSFVVWLDSAKFSLLNPFWSAELHLAPAQISSVTASYLLGYFPLLLLAGVLADRIGAKQMLIICILGVTVLSATMAFVHLRGDVVAQFPPRGCGSTTRARTCRRRRRPRSCSSARRTC
ncbi:MFS transporter [Pseudonocardia sp. GCM10023141]|uniref:MFS transporter n=1 Tax=Pseudonocardia sp. GCM10023141 TaxID=3252653 RepID=UPI00362290D0